MAGRRDNKNKAIYRILEEYKLNLYQVATSSSAASDQIWSAPDLTRAKSYLEKLRKLIESKYRVGGQKQDQPITNPKVYPDINLSEYNSLIEKTTNPNIREFCSDLLESAENIESCASCTDSSGIRDYDLERINADLDRMLFAIEDYVEVVVPIDRPEPMDISS